MKMWTGRFQKELDEFANDFNSSIAVDWVMFQEDVEGSIAHATMLAEQGIIPQDEAAAIILELDRIRQELEEGILAINPKAEDIHMFMEEELTRRIGQAGKRLHTARSRNDQVTLDLRLYLKNQTHLLCGLLKDVSGAFITKAWENLDSIMPGYTHLQIAQPVTFAHHLMAYVQMFVRDLGRLSDVRKRMNELPLGSGALATTTYPINRERVRELLDFDRVTKNSLDSVSDRDYVMELNSALSILMVHLSRFSEELILWSTAEFQFIELDDSFTTGSSIMPQKKNPDMAELIRGKSGRVIGNSNALLIMMKGLPLAYNKDLQEDKELIFDSLNTVQLCLTVLKGMMETMKVNADNMRQAASCGFINATDCADYLTRKGMPFRDAYRITGQLVAHCIAHQYTLETLPLEVYHRFSDQFDQDIYDKINLDYCVSQRKVYGGPAKEMVRQQILETEELLVSI